MLLAEDFIAGFLKTYSLEDFSWPVVFLAFAIEIVIVLRCLNEIGWLRALGLVLVVNIASTMLGFFILLDLNNGFQPERFGIFAFFKGAKPSAFWIVFPFICLASILMEFRLALRFVPSVPRAALWRAFFWANLASFSLLMMFSMALRMNVRN